MHSTLLNCRWVLLLVTRPSPGTAVQVYHTASQRGAARHHNCIRSLTLHQPMTAQSNPPCRPVPFHHCRKSCCQHSAGALGTTTHQSQRSMPQPEQQQTATARPRKLPLQLQLTLQPSLCHAAPHCHADSTEQTSVTATQPAFFPSSVL